MSDFPEVVNPSPDLTRLAAFLCEREYSSLARGTVLSYAAATGTLEGCPMLEPEDRPDADALLEAAWPPVPSASHAWEDADRRGYDGPPCGWTVPDAEELHDRARVSARIDRLIADAAPVPPELDVIDGEADPFEPTAEDLADLAAWSDSLYPEAPEDFALGAAG
jgi:hypothetical protein